MKLKHCLLGMSFFAVAMTATAQDNAQDTKTDMIEVTDITSESKKFDGYIYITSEKHYIADSLVVSEKYYAADSIDSILSIAKKDKEDIESMGIVSASNPYSKGTIESVKKRLPEKYRELKGLITIYLRNKKEEEK